MSAPTSVQMPLEAIERRRVMLLKMANKRYASRGKSEAELEAINLKSPMGLTCNGKYIYSVDSTSGDLVSEVVEAAITQPSNFQEFLDRIAADRATMVNK